MENLTLNYKDKNDDADNHIVLLMLMINDELLMCFISHIIVKNDVKNYTYACTFILYTE